VSVAEAFVPTGQVPAARDAHPGALAASREREALGAALPSGQLWAVVLAGGDGTRVSSLSRGSTGEPAPKQYCAFGSGEPLLLQALRRAAGLVARSRIVVVVAEQHRRHWREALADLPPENIVVQPRNRGTAPGVLLPVLEIVLHRDRDARVLVLPADHHVGSEDVLERALREAARAVRRPGAPVVLLGMAGEEGDHEYGWILPAVRPSAGVRPVLSFVEKPDPETSRGLASDGALVNSFIFASRGTTLVRLFEDAVPDLARVMVPFVLAGSPRARLHHLYDEIPTLDSSRAVLERAPGSLGVLAVPPCGWSDLGTPSRLESFLGRRARVDRAARDAGAAVV
jgi:mannose-1-phosphate guanylyltransferase